ncbi:MAG TPA: tetratricopeptide repeat protein [Myxococcota bacterium]|nr:tetratricopeptide repeat protein [Myxococcota bacterium]
MWLASLLACDPVGRADRYLEQGRSAEAVVYYGRANSLDDAATQRYARALLQEGRLDEAAGVLEGVESPDHNGHLVAGSLLAEAGEMELALLAFEAGLKERETPALAVNACIARLGLDRDPLPACQDAVSTAPMDPRAYAGLAEASARAEMPETAKEALSRAVKHYDGDPTTALWIGQGWVAVGEVSEACRWSIQLAQPPVLFGRACLAADQGARALEILEPLAEEDDEAAALLLRRSVDVAESSAEGPDRHQRIEQARRWERRLEEVEEVGVLTDRGRLASVAGDVLEAEALWRRAMELDPSEPAPRNNLAASLASRGQDEALRALALEGESD